MRKKIVGLSVVLLIVSAMFLPVFNSEAATGVRVTLPTFKVTLNGVSVSNSDSKYPLIVYNGITYFPMTYYDSRFMGLETIWSNTKGLEIVKTGGNWDHHKYPSASKNSYTYTAQIAAFNIKVNGKSIDNSHEKYPLLLFRDITYFPLTWKFAVTEFGWQYAFDATQGLSINTASGNVSIGEVILPIVKHADGTFGDFTATRDFFYFEGASGKIYQAHKSSPSKHTFVYQLPQSETGFGYVYASLYTDDQKSFLKYHTGGATMGSDHVIELKDDATTRILDSDYSNFRVFDSHTVRVEQWFPPAKNNLEFKLNPDSEYVKIGNPDFTYGLYIKNTSPQISAQKSDDLEFIENHIYVLGYEGAYDAQNIGTTGLYKINVMTGVTTRLCDASVERFKIRDNIIYFTDAAHSLYRMPLDGDNPELLVDKPVDLFEAMHGHIYYSLDINAQMHEHGKNEVINLGGNLLKLDRQGDNLVAYFDNGSQPSYKIIVLNQDGQVVYQTYENLKRIISLDNKLFVIKAQ